eukprot:2880101-Rhodomonas_salina.1
MLGETEGGTERERERGGKQCKQTKEGGWRPERKGLEGEEGRGSDPARIQQAMRQSTCNMSMGC